MELVIQDPNDGRPRVRLLGELRQGRSYELAMGELLEGGGRCVLKTARYSAGAGPDEVRERRDALELEADVLSTACAQLPEPVGLFSLAADAAAEHNPALAGREPVLAYRYIDGVTLGEWIARHHPDGADLESGLSLLRQLATGLHSLHEHGFVHRALAPEHLLVTESGELFIVGLGNVARRDARPGVCKEWAIDRYSAPEIVGERSGRFVAPRADTWSFGALMAFVFTGEAPSSNPDAPLVRRAHERLAVLPTGVGLLVAHCMQPLAKKRSGNFGRIGAMLTSATLPSAKTDGFAEIALVAPVGASGVPNAPVGHLSAGPLVNRTAGPDEARADRVTSEGRDQADSADAAAVPPHGAVIAARMAMALAALAMLGLLIARLLGEG